MPRSSTPPDHYLVGTALLTLVVHLALIGWNRGEYTDGILQLTLFANENTYLPPLYTALTWIPRLLGLDAILSGRLVSILASTLVLWPLFSLAERTFGLRAARLAVLVYAVLAVPNRWSIRVMTDPLFTYFFIAGIDAYLQCWRGYVEKGRARSFAALLLHAGLASLTRYQGLIFVPMILHAGWLALRDRQHHTRAFAVRLLAAMAPWAVFAWWLSFRGMTHGTQFAERAGATLWDNVMVNAIMSWHFLYFLPYVLTWPVFLAMLSGVARTKLWQAKQCQYLTVFIPVFIMWLVVHAAFQSFQYRYLLPLMPLLAIFAGHGLVGIEDWLRGKKAPALLVRGFTVVALVWSLGFSGAVIFYQRNAWATFPDTAAWVRENVPEGVRVWSDETYGPGHRFIPNVKMEFYSGREMPSLFLPEDGRPVPGDYIVLHNEYSGPQLLNDLRRDFRLQRVYETEYRLLPLLPDIMTNPPVTSRPEAMRHRYRTQIYRGEVYRVE